jgi:hypothetical protein
VNYRTPTGSNDRARRWDDSGLTRRLLDDLVIPNDE